MASLSSGRYSYERTVVSSQRPFWVESTITWAQIIESLGCSKELTGPMLLGRLKPSHQRGGECLHQGQDRHFFWRPRPSCSRDWQRRAKLSQKSRSQQDVDHSHRTCIRRRQSAFAAHMGNIYVSKYVDGSSHIRMAFHNLREWIHRHRDFRAVSLCRFSLLTRRPWSVSSHSNLQDGRRSMH